MKLTFSKKILISAVITLLIVLVLDVIFVQLLLNKIININDKVRQIDISSQERLNELNLKDSVASTIIEREKLEKYFVKAGTSETVAFTKYLENLALEMGLTQNKTLDYAPIDEPGLTEVASAIRFKFTISGAWANVYGFLRAIETLPKVVSLNSTSMSRNSDNKNWSATLDFSVIQLKN